MKLPVSGGKTKLIYECCVVRFDDLLPNYDLKIKMLKRPYNSLHDE